MFTIEQIHEAHSKVKSGADFPAYIKAIKALGVKEYKTFVQDGHTEFTGTDGHHAASRPKYEELTIANTTNGLAFKQYLKNHQQGGSDYFTFCRQCAETGVHHWYVSLEEMTCTYFDKAGNEILVEQIPR